MRMFQVHLRGRGIFSSWERPLPPAFGRQLAEEMLFEALVAGEVTIPGPYRYQITGLLNPERYSPFLVGFEATVWGEEFYRTHHYAFQSAWHYAQALIQDLIEEGRLEVGCRVTWGVTIGEDMPASGLGHILDEPTLSLPEVLPPPRRVGRARFQVRLPDSVLRQAWQEVQVEPALERGGFLLGRLHRRPDDQVELLLEEAIPAEAVEPGAASLGFTPATWTCLQAQLAGRPDGLRLGGWFHSHPCFDLERAGDPPESRLFLSLSDWEVMTTSFPAPFQVALVLASAPDQAEPCGALFGWRAARLVALIRRQSDVYSIPIDRGAPAP